MQKILIKQPARAGELRLEPGEYVVALLTEQGVFQLTGKGLDFKIPAVRRPLKKANLKIASFTFYSGGGKTWTLSMSVPNRGEWIGSIVYE